MVRRAVSGTERLRTPRGARTSEGAGGWSLRGPECPVKRGDPRDGRRAAVRRARPTSPSTARGTAPGSPPARGEPRRGAAVEGNGGRRRDARSARAGPPGWRGGRARRRPPPGAGPSARGSLGRGPAGAPRPGRADGRSLPAPRSEAAPPISPPTRWTMRCWTALALLTALPWALTACSPPFHLPFAPTWHPEGFLWAAGGLLLPLAARPRTACPTGGIGAHGDVRSGAEQEGQLL